MINSKISESMGRQATVFYATREDLEKKYDHIYLTTDWHLFIKDRESELVPAPVKMRDNLAYIVSQYEQLSENDLLIHLGDIADDELYDLYDDYKAFNMLDTVMRDIKCQKILLLGNNDPVEKKHIFEWLGFKVFDGMVIDDIVLTHQPFDISWSSGLFNIHGHSHGHSYYWRAPYTHHLDIWHADRRPVPLDRRVLDNLWMDYVPFVKDISHLHLPDKKAFEKFKGGSLKNKGNI